MRDWSYNLVSLDIDGVFDGSLFWPHASEKRKMPLHHWPRLRNFYVRLGVSTPTGGWYFGHTSKNLYRNVPLEDKLQPLFESWVKGLQYMPVLEQALVLFNITLEIRQVGFRDYPSVKNWAIGFQAPGLNPYLTRAPWGKNLTADHLDHPRIVYQNVGSWQPYRSALWKLYAMGKFRFPDKKMIELDVDTAGRITDICRERKSRMVSRPWGVVEVPHYISSGLPAESQM
ncbi:hypothetical protein F4781DRAFT_429104 [Annulohypoxylon bovei var. microspora]|nr:hypothetical protein F4781DRAFT_429104 [Annulohypoxylon bovei var. microspora]